MDKIEYLDIDKLVNIYNKFDSDDITGIQIELEKIIDKHKGIKYKDKLYRFTIERMTDLLFDVTEDKKVNEINIVYVDVNYVRLIVDVIKFLHQRLMFYMNKM